MEILKVNKKIKIHIKNNHGRSGTFPCHLEGEKNFTITKKHIQKALENEPQIRKQVEFFIDWDEDNFNSSMSSSEILLTYDFPTKKLKAIAPNLKWIHCTAAGVEHLSPFNWASDDLIITNSSGVHAKAQAHLFQLLFIMRINAQEITRQLKTNLGLGMQISPILKNMALETTEVVEDSQLEKQLAA